MKKIDFITLGCSKNLVDTEKLMRQFEAAGFSVTHDADSPEGDIVVINTCGFIGDAKQESIDMILEYCDAKKRGDIKGLYVMGCLSERYFNELKCEIPEVDGFYGKFNYNELLNDLGQRYNNDIYLERHLTTPNHYAYLKISEGCNRTCSYCAIPIITGKYKSKPIEELVDEVKYLVSKGVKEFQLIAQDLTYYGYDLYKKYCIAELVEKISDIQGVEWIRLHYGYPANFPYDLLKVMRERDNVCKYIDIALQHCTDNMLKLMRRGLNKQKTIDLLERIRKEVPGICVRTTLMVGHPGETEQDFLELVEFAREQKFERMGAFAYSNEDDTYSALNYTDDIDDETKQVRLDRLMKVQQSIAYDHNQSLVGKCLKVIVDRQEGEYYICRTEFDSPEVDTEVLISYNDYELEIGEFYYATITKAEEFDFYAEIYD